MISNLKKLVWDTTINSHNRRSRLIDGCGTFHDVKVLDRLHEGKINKMLRSTDMDGPDEG